ncbi:phosphopantetheine-binding protein [Bacillus velezensis]|uniref:alpha/beta fold hydrolase n=1 Tax=Bacillus velezensis TaxID=492670 RepID=UPI000C76E7F0|nr:alpha/beta hydrolase [Bacillus velezensis]AUJ59595.1 phosphopantetheine-binding protein [Bacillus velezensis]
MTDRVELDEKTFAGEVERITATFSEVLGIEYVSPGDNFFKLGGDSFDAVRVMSRLGGNLQIVAIFEYPTAEELARYILHNSIRRDVRLVPLHDESTADGSIAVVAVPFGGGDPTAYRDIFRGNQDVRVFGVDFGDLEVKETSDFSELINKLITEIEKIDADQLIIYGHCAGAATAACIASAIAPTVSSLTLVVAASQPIDNPDAALREAETTSDYEWGQYLRSLGAFTGLTDEEVDGMLARGRRDHLIATEAYRTLTHLQARGMPALVLLGDEDPATPQPNDVVNKWRSFIDVTKSAILSGGGHYFIRTHAQEVADIVLSFAADNRNGGK